MWAYGSLDPRKSVRDALDLAGRCGLNPPPVLWVDCETYSRGDRGPDAAWLREAVEECRARGVRPGIYTGGWWWRGYLGNIPEFADLPLWTAEYDGILNPAKVELYGGWTRACGKQWSAAGLDRDVFLEEVCIIDGARPVPPTIDDLKAINPHIREQLAMWQAERIRNAEDPHDHPAFQKHLIGIGAPDPGAVEFTGFLRPTVGELEARNPNIRAQLVEWQAERIRNGEDRYDYPAFRQHLLDVFAPDPGLVELIEFRG